MKICHISTGFPISYQGGITNYVRALAEYQVSQGHDVDVISGPDKEKFSFHTEQYKSNTIIPMKWRAPIDKDGLEKIRAFLDENKFDLIHIHMMLDVDWDIYEVVKKYNYVISLHDYFFICPRIQMLMHDNSICTGYEEEKCRHCISWFNTKKMTNALEYKISHYTKWKTFRLPEIPSNMTKIRYHKFKVLLENAKFLLPVSNRVQEIFENSGINGNYRMLHIGNISADHYSDEYKFDYNKPKINIAMLGTLSHLKGADLFVKMAEASDKEKVQFHFYGRSNGYSDKIKSVGIIDHGPYKQAELSDILKNIDMGLCLSVWEDNAPQVVMEFLNNHIPVIGTRLGGIPDFINDGENGILFDPFNIDDFNRVIKVINSMTREELGEYVSKVKKTTTSHEHFVAINQIYLEAIK